MDGRKFRDLSSDEESVADGDAQGKEVLASSFKHNPSSLSCNYINSLMSIEDVIAYLGNHGCENITKLLDPSSFSSRPLFTGGFGDVYRGTLRNSTAVAIKTMRIHAQSEADNKPLKNAARELHTWSKCQHPNVLKLLGLANLHGQLGMVSLWMKNGNLPAYLNQQSGVDRHQISTEICEGLSYLHSENITHGDLKGLNVLISDSGTPMLTDFGNAVLQESTLQFTATTQKYQISIRWAAPELIEGTGTYSFEADVYALGMTILEAMTGGVPYQGTTHHGLYYIIVVKKEPPKRPEDSIPTTSPQGDALWSLLRSCWSYHPRARPSVTRALTVMKSITQEGLMLLQQLPMRELRPNSPSSGQLYESINSLMSIGDVIAFLVDHGCNNMTPLLDNRSFSSEPIAGGGSSDIYMCTLMDGIHAAVKTKRIHVHSEEEKPLKDAARELYTWSKCQHPNVHKLLGLVVFRGEIGMVSLWMKNGNLPAYLNKHLEANRCQMSTEICKGLSYLHGQGIIHGHLKGPHVLISDDGTPVVTGFGNAVLQQSTLQFTTTTQKFNISVRWAAPELIAGLSTYSFAADVYALGMTILEAMTGKAPYYYQTNLSITRIVVDQKEHPRRPEDNIPITSQHGDALWSLLTSCWAYEPEERPGVNHVLSIMKTITQEE